MRIQMQPGPTASICGPGMTARCAAGRHVTCAIGRGGDLSWRWRFWHRQAGAARATPPT
ncbi:uncharacterized protein CANTADRAFT_203786 [Suhomyces tanzawaensis NRRL Y-17324]|uniref:Uncharacterized protein n=1 Tax=Suhomyces tanzawaensis NRRL Y-17324 TaxID=984487 RepID=A0A1E4SP90_9ASCO|nr:uncharacterized protein CANTADRAFT_203786 [Suhomyces tanzawaensis NRRL Y-17324]ODV81298.1 hypothetical protein CANTADRAFT_203786 [Suhomyces tanzawaensis NRRL Y-17324]